jgi:phosphohistidine phosphatase
MKVVYLIRHAKSSWEHPGVSDFDRPLNERGKRDAPRMAEKLRARGATIQFILSSTARRAVRTAEAFARVNGIGMEDIEKMDELYLAPPERYRQAIEELDDRYERVAIVGHNDGISDFANELGVARIDSMPTCSVLAVSADTSHWRDFMVAHRRFECFLYPKDPNDPLHG